MQLLQALLIASTVMSSIFVGFNYLSYSRAHTNLCKRKQEATLCKSQLRYIEENKKDWQKCAHVNLELLYVWFFERQVQMKLVNKFEAGDYIDYRLQLSCTNDVDILNLIRKLPFGIVHLEKIKKTGNRKIATISLLFSNAMKEQNIQLQYDTKPLRVVLSGIIKQENDYIICLNGNWLKYNDELPSGLKIEEISADNVIVSWNTFGKIKKYKLYMGEEIQLNHEYDF